MSEEFGEYNIGKRVGGSGFGDCYAATKKSGSDNKAYILKTLFVANTTMDKIKILQNEIYILDKLNEDLNCKYIPKLYAFDKENYPKNENIKEKNENKIFLCIQKYFFL